MSSLIIGQIDNFFIFNTLSWSPIFVFKGKSVVASSLPFTSLHDLQASSEFVLIRLSYVSAAKSFNAVLSYLSYTFVASVLVLFSVCEFRKVLSNMIIFSTF